MNGKKEEDKESCNKNPCQILKADRFDNHEVFYLKSVVMGGKYCKLHFLTGNLIIDF